MATEKEERVLKLAREEEEEDEDDDVLESRKKELQKTFPQDWDVVNSIIQHILSKGQAHLSPAYKIGSILEKYQGQGQLLKPYVEGTVSPLMSLIRSKSAELGVKSKELLDDVIKPVCIIIYSLVKVCGYKAVMKFMPHQASDVEFAVPLLERFIPGWQIYMGLRHEKHGWIESKVVILLWLSLIVLDSAEISSVDGEPKKPRKVLRTIELLKGFLTQYSPVRSKAGVLLSRVFTRADMIKAFNSFMDWAHELLFSMDFQKIFQLVGAAEALDRIFKTCSQKQLIGVVPTVWSDTLALFKSDVARPSPLLRKYLIKLTQRIGLILLPDPSPPWRYVVRNATLGESKQKDDVDVPKITEEIIELLLSGLRDTETIVRCSAAKGIGRITSHLAYSRAEAVLSSVLELFSPGEGHASWHGGCLALAELARGGALLPICFHKVMPVVEKALHYDIQKGPHRGGSNVREAAAYVCWAFGRAYHHTDMKIVLQQLAPHLLTVACYDREVNCRRAASAAFQENVGRQGNYPHGIDIVNTADYFAVLSRENSYLHVAVSIAQYDGYLYPFVDELLHSKICHWDKDLRVLAAKALSALVKHKPKYFATTVLEKLIPCTLSSNLRMRHGATLAAGEVILALHEHGRALSKDMRRQVAGVVPAIEKARLYRGKGGEIVRSAVSRFIQCTSIAHVRLTGKIKRRLLDTLHENLRQPNSNIQKAAAEALKHFIPAYLVTTENKDIMDVLLKYVEQLTDSNVATRRGSALAIGVLPFEVLAKSWKDVLSKLCRSCVIKENPEDTDAEARMNAVKGLVSVCETLTETARHSDFFSGEDSRSLYLFIKNEVMESLLKALDDYSADNRGDVGSWVREASIIGLEKCTYILCRKDSSGRPSKPEGAESELQEKDSLDNNKIESFFDENLSTRLIGGVIKQAVEKMDKLRELAAKVLRRILYNKTTFVPFIPSREKLESIASDEDSKWGEPTFSYPRFIQLLKISDYSKYVTSGLVVAVGELQISLRMASLNALLEYLRTAETKDLNGSREFSLAKDILWVLQEYKRCDRVIVPTLQVIEILFSKKVFLNMEGYTPEFCAGVLDSLTTELEVPKGFYKKYAGIAILGYISSLSDPISNRAFACLLALLSDRYYKTRDAAAEQVYLILLQNENLMAKAEREKALETICETRWECCSIEEAKTKRLQLCQFGKAS